MVNVVVQKVQQVLELVVCRFGAGDIVENIQYAVARRLQGGSNTRKKKSVYLFGIPLRLFTFFAVELFEVVVETLAGKLMNDAG